MKRGLLILWCVMCVWIGASATVPPRTRKAGGEGSAQAFRAPWMQSERRAALQQDAPLRSLGVQRIPVVLVEFADLHFQVATSPEDLRVFYDKFCNGTRDGILYTGAGSYGSVRDYFVQQSDSLFLPEFDVFGPVTLSSGYAYYGKDNGSIHDVNINTFVTQAVLGAQELAIDWTKYDNDGDGKVDMVYFIYAGEGENGCEDKNTIWPHGKVNDRTIGSQTYGAYSCSNELYLGTTDGIGTMCHEMGHNIGLPDFYDTQGKEYGMDYWDIMDSGCYCSKGTYPCGYSAYEKDFMGWRKLVDLTRDEDVTLTLQPISAGGIGYRMRNPDNEHEYYILENRQNIGWDMYIGRGTLAQLRHGMLVTHVDYSVSRWTYNNVNTSPNHPCFTIIPADGDVYSYSLVETDDELEVWKLSADGDLFPGSKRVTNLFADRQPIYTKSASMHQPLTNICEHEDGSMTLTVCRFADVNGDGTVDTQDVLAIYRYIQTQENPKSHAQEDVNGDQIVDSQDVLKVYDYMVGK
ncbi:MAG: M6 family metalloprotease domain-containing protein [Bacteroidaceae bacterium]|nr:M6 family metalloprotease domain-containing protein [Bacteroidaceae bacterium]